MGSVGRGISPFDVWYPIYDLFISLFKLKAQLFGNDKQQ